MEVIEQGLFEEILRRANLSISDYEKIKKEYKKNIALTNKEEVTGILNKLVGKNIVIMTADMDSRYVFKFPKGYELRFSGSDMYIPNISYYSVTKYFGSTSVSMQYKDINIRNLPTELFKETTEIGDSWTISDEDFAEFIHEYNNVSIGVLKLMLKRKNNE
jgi:hypothetical protein